MIFETRISQVDRLIPEKEKKLNIKFILTTSYRYKFIVQ